MKFEACGYSRRKIPDSSLPTEHGRNFEEASVEERPPSSLLRALFFLPVPAFGRQSHPVFEVGTSEPKRAIVVVWCRHVNVDSRILSSLILWSTYCPLAPTSSFVVNEKPAARQGVSGISMKRKGKPNTNIAQRGSFNQMQQQVPPPR